MALKRLYEPQRVSESFVLTELRNTHFIGNLVRDAVYLRSQGFTVRV